MQQVLSKRGQIKKYFIYLWVQCYHCRYKWFKTNLLYKWYHSVIASFIAEHRPSLEAIYKTQVIVRQSMETNVIVCLYRMFQWGNNTAGVQSILQEHGVEISILNYRPLVGLVHGSLHLYIAKSGLPTIVGKRTLQATHIVYVQLQSFRQTVCMLQIYILNSKQPTFIIPLRNYRHSCAPLVLVY